MSPLLPLLVLAALVGSTFSTTPCITLGLAASYDVIVVGSGAGGAVAARRLAERNPSWKILSIERGPAYSTCADCQGSGGSNIDNPGTGRFITTQPQTAMFGQTTTIKDAAIQGGATAINGMEHNRGNEQYYFNTFWPSSWSWDTMIPFYIQYENYHYPPGFYPPGVNPYLIYLRGNQGLVDVTQTLTTQNYITATKEVFPNIFPAATNYSLNNGYLAGFGTASEELSNFNGLRSSSYTSYLRSYTGSNLIQIVGTRVNKVLFSGNQVTGVQIVSVDPISGNATSGTCTVSSSKVIVSAGTMNTPKLLKLSGVGPQAELQALGIRVVSNVPDVGANLDDHITMGAVMTGTPAGVPHLILWNGQDDPTKVLNLQVRIEKTGTGVDDALVIAHYLSNRDGTVTLASTNPDSQPILDPKYFTVAADKANFAIAFNKSLQVFANLGMVNVANPCTLGGNCATPLDQLNSYIEFTLWGTGLHLTATSSICKVVSPIDLSVKGTKGLYVLDASILPRTPGANTQSTTYAVSERGIDQIELSWAFPELLPSNLFSDC